MTVTEGCEACREACRVFIRDPNELMKELFDCTSSFRNVDCFFSAKLWCCPKCATLWLGSSREDFLSGADNDDGKRIYVSRPLDTSLVATIESARDTRQLDIDTFGT